MNKIYKVIWSKVRGCYVVVSEFAKSHTKDKKRKAVVSGIVFNSLALGVFFSVIGIGVCYSVFAAGVEASGTSLGSHTVAVGDSAVAGSYKHIVVVDDCDSETGEPVYWSDGSAATGLTDGVYYIDSVGKLIMNQSDESLRLVHDGAVAVGYNAQALSDNSIALGNSSSAYNINGIAVGYNSIVSADNSIAIGGNSQSFGSDSVALGYNSSANSADTVAVGFHAAASEHGGLAVGAEAKSSGEYSTAIGADASALNSSSTSLGANAVAGGYKFVKVVGGKAENGGAVYYSDGTSASSLPDGIYYVNLAGKILLDQNDVSLRVVQDNATAIGSGSSALGADSSAFGYNSYSSGVSSVALGNDAKSTGGNSVALGKNALSKLENSVAIGYGAVAGPSDSTTNITNLSDSVAIGTNANAAGNRSISVGSSSSVTGNNSIGIGYQTVVSGDNSYVIGNGASATASYGNAIGYGAQSTGNYSIAIGLQSIASVGDAIAFGHSASSSGTGAIAFGRNSEGTGISSVSLGDAAKATNSYAEALGYKSSASGNSSSAVGSNSSAAGTQSGAFGYQASAAATGSLALGGSTTASSNYSTAIGYKSTASGEKSIALGYSNKVVGASSGAIGDPNNVYGGSSYVIGNNNTVGQDGSTVLGVGTFVLGNNISTTANNSVALGNNTTLTEDDVVSVGSETAQRRIVNVADGTSASNAATVGQTIELVAGDGVSIEETGTNAIGQKQYTVSSPLSVQYDSDTKDVISLAGAAGTKITNISDGEVSSTSSDAVTGSQLYAEQQTRITADSVLQTAVSDEATARTEADTALSGRIDTVDSNISAINNDISSLQSKDSEITSSLNDLSDSAVKYSSEDKASVVLGGATGTVISNVKNGTVSETSTEAVTGSQLYAEQQARINADNALTNSINNEISIRQNTDNALSDRIDTVSDSVALSVKYVDGTKASVVLDGESGTVISNVKGGAVSESSTEAVTGSQLYAEQQSRISSDNLISGRLDGLDSSVSDLDSRVSDVETDLATEVSNRADSDNALSARIDSLSADVSSSVSYDSGDKDKITFEGVSGTVLSNIKAGTLSETSTEAVTGSQLYTEQQARIAQDNTLQDNIDAEVSARTNADNTLSGRIDSVDSSIVSINSGISDLQAKDTEISGTLNSLSDIAVKYSNTDKDNIVLGGAAGTTISNLKEGTVSSSSTEAVTGSQLYAEQQTRITADTVLQTAVSDETTARTEADTALSGRIDTVDSNISAINNDISSLQTKDSEIFSFLSDLSDSVVKYSSDDKSSVVLEGAAGTVISNVKNGTVSETSTEAVNGSQLYAEQQARINQDNILAGSVSDEILARQAADNTLMSRIDTVDSSISTINSSISGLQNKNSELESDLNDLEASSVKYSTSDNTVLTFSGAGGTLLSNLAEGTVSETSTDAVTGSQLYSEQQARISADNTLTNSINNEVAIRQATDNALSDRIDTVSDNVALSVKYSDSTKASVVLDGESGTVISNVKNGIISETSTEAVNGSQLYAEQQARINADSAFSSDILSLQNKDSELASNLSSEITARADADTNLSDRISALNLTVSGISDSAVKYDSDTSDVVTLAGSSGTKITNIAAGAVSDVSTDAVTGSQLYAEQQARTSSDNNLSGRIDTLDGLLSSETSTRQSEDARIEARIDSINTSIGNIENAVVYDDSNKGVITLSGVDGTKITNLANGVVSDASTDAITGSQLYAETQNRITQDNALDVRLGNVETSVSSLSTKNTELKTSIDNEIAERESEVSRLDLRIDSINTSIGNVDNAVFYDSSSKDKVTLSGTAGTVIDNVKAGGISDISMQAVNGSQLYAEQQARLSADNTLSDKIDAEISAREALSGVVSSVETSLGNLTSSVSDLDSSVVKYSDSNKETIVLDGVDGTKISNVANGNISDSSSEAVTGAQLYAEIQSRTAQDDALGTRLDTVDTSITALGVKDTELKTSIDNEIAERESEVSRLDLRIDSINSSIGNIENAVLYDNSTKDTISLAGTSGTKITNLANGVVSDVSTDAVTGNQLYAEQQARLQIGSDLTTEVSARAAADTALSNSLNSEISERESEVSRLDTRIDFIDTAISNIDNVVSYDSDPKDKITLSGLDGTKITNLSDGVLSDTSTDAVSGKQLYAEQQARISSDNNLSGRIDTLDGLLSSETSTRQSEDARIEARIDSINASIGNIDNVVLYDDSTKNTVSLAGTSGTKITNLADGVVSDISTDAVSGKQLYAEQQARIQIGSDLAAEVSARTAADTALRNSLDSEVSERESEVSRLDTRIDSIDTAISNIDNVVSYDSASKDKITLSGLGGTKITNLADGVLSETSTDAVSGSQLYAEQQARISSDSALQNSINTEAADRSNADNVLSGKIDTLNGSLSTVNSSISGLQTKDSQIENALNSEVSLRESEDSRIEARIDAINTSISDIDNAVYYSDSSKNEISFEGASGTKLKNVAEGELSNSSMEAVNGSQLYAEQQARIAADSSLQDSLNSEITARTNSDNVLSGRLDTVASDISVLQAKDTALESALSDEVSARTSANTVLSGRIDAVVSDLSDLDDSVVKYSSDKSSVALAGVNGTVLDNLKAGEISETSMQAVNGSQLYAEQQDRINSDNTLSSRIDNEVSARTNADVALSDRIDALSSGISGLSEAVLYSNGKAEINLEGIDGTLITNLKEGSLSDSSTDAVRGSQLYAEKTARENSDIVIGNRLDTVESSISDIDSSAVRYDGMSKDKMTLSGVSGTVIGNVAAGEISASSMEAINGSQLYAEQQARISSVNTLTNSLADEVSLREAKDAEIAQSVSDEILARQNAVSALSSNLSSEVARLDSADAAIRTSITNEASLRDSADTAINARIDSLAGDVGSISSSGVIYDDASSASLSFRGASGTVLKNVAQGEVSENSMEAVNGSQLYAEQQARIDLGNQLGTRIDNEVSVLSQKDDEIEDALNTEIVNRENAVAGLRNELTDMVNGVSGSMVSYSSSDKSHIFLAGSGGTVISNLRAGEVSAVSTEAVTGSQLYAEQQAREAAVADIEGRLDNIEAVTGNNVIGYDNTDKDSVTFAGDSGTTLKNVADGSISEGSMEAVNGGQLYDEQQARIEADNALRNEFGNMVAGITDNVIKYDDDSDKGTLTFAGDSGTVLKNVAGGDISEGSMEAVNGGQLYETNKKIETLDNRVGVVKDGSFVKENNTISENINSLDDAVAANSSAIEELGGKVQNGFNVLGRRVNNAGAHAAALAALNPVAEDDSKLGFAAGMGSYHNAKAGAVGLFYRPADRYQISIGGTTGGGEHMYNLGLSVALDKNVGGPFANKKAMTREIVRLRDERDIRDEQMKDLLEENRAQAEVLMVQNEKIAELENSRAEQDAKIDALMKMVHDIQKGNKAE